MNVQWATSNTCDWWAHCQLNGLLCAIEVYYPAVTFVNGSRNLRLKNFHMKFNFAHYFRLNPNAGKLVEQSPNGVSLPWYYWNDVSVYLQPKWKCQVETLICLALRIITMERCEFNTIQRRKESTNWSSCTMEFQLKVGNIDRFRSGNALTIEWFGCAGSPYKFHVDSIGSGSVTAYGPGLSAGKAGEPANFTISTKGAGGGGLSLSVEGPSKANVNFFFSSAREKNFKEVVDPFVNSLADLLQW